MGGLKKKGNREGRGTPNRGALCRCRDGYRMVKLPCRKSLAAGCFGVWSGRKSPWGWPGYRLLCRYVTLG